jgi:nucleoside-diphosphate-sugar epimerase
VFHTASPFFFTAKEEKELVEPAVNGTRAVLAEAARGRVRRVVLTSSTAAMMGGSSPADASVGWNVDTDWSDEEVLRSRKSFYPLSKLLAERAAWAFVAAEKPSFDLVVLNPTLVTGPMLQPALNTSSEVVLDVATGKRASLTNGYMSFVDVRDVASAHVEGALRSEAAGRRFLLVSDSIPWTAAADAIRAALPEPLRARVTSAVEDQGPQTKTLYFTKPAQDVLGIAFRPCADSIADTVRSLLHHGFLKE